MERGRGPTDGYSDAGDQDDSFTWLLVQLLGITTGVAGGAWLFGIVTS